MMLSRQEIGSRRSIVRVVSDAVEAADWIKGINGEAGETPGCADLLPHPVPAPPNKQNVHNDNTHSVRSVWHAGAGGGRLRGRNSHRGETAGANESPGRNAPLPLLRQALRLILWVQERPPPPPHAAGEAARGGGGGLCWLPPSPRRR